MGRGFESLHACHLLSQPSFISLLNTEANYELPCRRNSTYVLLSAQSRQATIAVREPVFPAPKGAEEVAP